MTSARPAPNVAYAGQVVHFPDPVRAAQWPIGVQVDESGLPDFTPFAQATAEVAEPPDGFGVDELRVTDVVSANAALARAGHPLWQGLPPVVTPPGWTWHHVARTRRMQLVPTPVKSLLRHHGGLATSSADHGKRGTRPLQDRKPAHFRLPGGRGGALAVSEAGVLGLEESLGYRLPGPYRAFLKVAGGCPPVGYALDPDIGLLLDQPFFTVRGTPAMDDLGYVNKCLRDYLSKDYLGVAYAQGGIVAVKVRGESRGSVWFCPWDDARDADGMTLQERCAELLLPCGADFDEFLRRLAGSPPELGTVADLMVDGGFARPVEV